MTVGNFWNKSYMEYETSGNNELFGSHYSRYQTVLEISMWGRDLIFDSVEMMYYKCHKVNARCGGSYIGSKGWIKMKNATINPKNEDEKCFQYVVTVALNYGETESHPERISNIKPFINKYNWKGIYCPSKIDD